MTIEEIAKTICILGGFDRNLSFDSYPSEVVGERWYMISASNKDDESIYVHDSGTVTFLSNLLEDLSKYTKFDKIPHWMRYTNSPKYILDDEYRENRQAEEELTNLFNEKESEISQSFYQWIKENDPCPNCTINKKDHWDDIHYNCEEFHTMRCPILWEFMNKRDEKRKEMIQENPRYKSIKEYYEHQREVISKDFTKIYTRLNNKKNGK